MKVVLYNTPVTPRMILYAIFISILRLVKPSTSQLSASIAVQVRHQFPRNEGELFRTYSEQRYVHEAVVLVKKIPSTERSIPN